MSTIETNLAAFNQTLTRYQALSEKLPQEVLEKKGRDLSIQLYRAFSERKWGGRGKKPAGLARAELETRTAQGRGTLVRASLLREYKAKRVHILHDRRVAKWGKSTDGYLRSIRDAVSLWQSFVGREIGLRQKGIGVLAASFLWFRRRTNQTRGTFYVKNRTGRPLGFADISDGTMRIVGQTEGLEKVDSRYHVVASAIETARQDMVTYIRERHAVVYKEAFGELAA